MTASTDQPKVRPLAEGIESPHKHDVLFGRGAGNYNHYGNKTFRLCVSKHKESYDSSLITKKYLIARAVVEAVQKQDPPGRFLEKNRSNGLWYEVIDKTAIGKAQKALMDPRAARAGAAKRNGGKTTSETEKRTDIEPIVTHLKASVDAKEASFAGAEGENVRKEKRSRPKNIEASPMCSKNHDTVALEKDKKKMRLNQPLPYLTKNASAQKYFKSIMNMTPDRSAIPVTLRLLQQGEYDTLKRPEREQKEDLNLLVDCSVNISDNEQKKSTANNFHHTEGSMCETNSGDTEAELTEWDVCDPSQLSSSPSIASILETESLSTISCSQMSQVSIAGTPDATVFSISPSLFSQISMPGIRLSAESLALLTSPGDKARNEPTLQSNKKISLITGPRPRALGTEDRDLSLMKSFGESPIETRLRIVPKILAEKDSCGSS